MTCKIYTYESKWFCDLVLSDPDFGLIVISEWDRNRKDLTHEECFQKERWDNFDQYESTLKCNWVKTYIGTVN